MNAINLHTAVYQHNAARELLLKQFPSLSDDEEALLDTLEGCTDVVERITAVVRSAIEDEMLADASKARRDEMKAREDRLRARAERKKADALGALQSTSRRKLEAPDFTLSIRAGSQSVRITDEAAIPEEFLRTPPPPAPAPDKKAIGDALKAGRTVTGAELSNGAPTLAIRKG
jgi:hypothetical protein